MEAFHDSNLRYTGDTPYIQTQTRLCYISEDSAAVAFDRRFGRTRIEMGVAALVHSFGHDDHALSRKDRVSVWLHHNTKFDDELKKDNAFWQMRIMLYVHTYAL